MIDKINVNERILILKPGEGIDSFFGLEDYIKVTTKFYRPSVSRAMHIVTVVFV